LSTWYKLCRMDGPRIEAWRACSARGGERVQPSISFLAQELERRFPETRPQIIHRVYTLRPDDARLAFGDEVAAVVPEQGVVDVHRFLTVATGHDRIRIDVTFPSSSRWNGRSSMALACGAGTRGEIL
jgi:hypothetical protein